MTRTALALTGAVFLAAGLAGCGKVGQRERPGPLFGAERNSTRAADEAQRQQDPSRPPRTLPIPGTNTGPGATAPQSALPDPYTNPR